MTVEIERTGETEHAASPAHRPPFYALDLAAEIATLQQSERWLSEGTDSKTLIRCANLVLELALLNAGHQLADHIYFSGATIQVLIGRVRISLDGQPVNISARQTLVINQTATCEIAALDESAILMSRVGEYK